MPGGRLRRPGAPSGPQALARDFAIPNWYADARALIDHPDVEAITVCTNPPFHVPATLMATERGKHTIVEKPMTMDLAEADRAIAATRTRGRPLRGHLHAPVLARGPRARQAIDDGKLGRLITGDCILKWYRGRGATTGVDPWRGSWKGENGAALVNQAVHAIDMFLWLMGPAGQLETVYGKWANLTHPYIEAEDNAVAALRWANGALGVLSVTISTKPQLGARISVTGENGATVGVLEHPEGRFGLNDVWTDPRRRGGHGRDPAPGAGRGGAALPALPHLPQVAAAGLPGGHPRGARPRWSPARRGGARSS